MQPSKDLLEQFILDNREQFDDATPGLKVWAGIDKAVNARVQPRLQVIRVLRAAAAVAILLTIGGIGGYYFSRPAAPDAVAILQETDPEYFEMEQFYQDQINDKIQQLASYRRDNTVLTDLQDVDKAMEELKQELINAPKGKEQEIIANLIQSYQTKVAILEMVLERMEAANPQNVKSKTNEISL